MTPLSFTTALMAAMGGIDLLQPTKLIVIAHGAHESGWGKSRASSAHNVWNLTRSKSDTRPIIAGGDQEPDGHGGWRPITQRFRAYGSDEEAVRDYLTFLRVNPRYHAAHEALLLGWCSEFIRRIHDDDPTTAQVEGGFFTADLAGYQSGVAGCLATVRKVLAPAPGVA